ncbi:MAG: hypothetical protein JXP73_14520 [Deltaproteobacteria bacterium]|nr:hypothetical protein [Deltaproteobacteria bacterium]
MWMRHLLPLLSVFAGVSACVVPVGPEWTDPQSNYPPTIASASPAIGSILALAPDAGFPLAVQVKLADQNTDDNLYVLWLIDYPPFVDGVSRLARPEIQPGNGRIERPTLTFAPNCGDHRIAAGFGAHRLLLVASDRPFVGDDPTEPDKIQDGNSRVQAQWQFDMECP